MKKTIIRTPLLLTAAVIQLTVFSCQKTGVKAPVKPMGLHASASADAVIPVRKSLVYFSTVDEPGDDPGSMDQLADPANASQWSYVAANAAGYCQNFITMNAANVKGNVATLHSVLARFTNKNCYYSGDGVNPISWTSYPNSAANEQTWLQQIVAQGFNVNSTDIFNLSSSTEQAALITALRTSPSNLRVGGGPFSFGGDITSNTNDNANIRSEMTNLDGMSLDGPMGLWATDQNQMQEGTVSAASYVHGLGKKISFVMAPSGFGVTGPTTYTTAQYLTQARNCVQYIEDHNQYMDEWEVFPYHAQGLAIFPESAVVNGQTVAQPTQAGVAYYLLKHLNNLPALGVTTGIVPPNVTVTPGFTSTSIAIGAGIARSYTLPISFTNGNQPDIDIAPLITAAISGATGDWSVKFQTSTGLLDITNSVLNGGFNCISFWRLTSTNNFTLNVTVTALKTNSQPISINLVTAANYANTGPQISYGINAKTQ